MNKKIIIIAITILSIIVLTFAFIMNLSKQEIKTDKQTIYDMFTSFPESKNVYYTYKRKYTAFSIGPTIYQIYILAELTDDAYNSFVSQVEFEKLDNFETRVNPKGMTYDWKNVKNTNIIESKNDEIASIQSIYLDENAKTIYVTVIGGN